MSDLSGRRVIIKMTLSTAPLGYRVDVILEYLSISLIILEGSGFAELIQISALYVTLNLV